jgi:hypothetical protein
MYPTTIATATTRHTTPLTAIFDSALSGLRVNGGVAQTVGTVIVAAKLIVVKGRDRDSYSVPDLRM